MHQSLFEGDVAPNKKDEKTSPKKTYISLTKNYLSESASNFAVLHLLNFSRLPLWRSCGKTPSCLHACKERGELIAAP